MKWWTVSAGTDSWHSWLKLGPFTLCTYRWLDGYARLEFHYMGRMRWINRGL